MSSHQTSNNRPLRSWFIGALIGATVLLTFGGVPAVAQAVDVSSVADLQAALSSGTDSTITLSNSAYDTSRDILVDRDVTIDLNGHELMASSFTVTAGKTLTLLGASALYMDYVNINGTLQLGGNLGMRWGTSVSVGATGSIVSVGGTFAVQPVAAIENLGTITAILAPEQSVTGNNYTMRFVGKTLGDDFQDVTVFAPTLDAAGVAIPEFSRVHASISAWTSGEDGSGSTITTTTDLSELPLWSTYYAQWVASGISSIGLTYDGSPDAVAAGSTKLTALDTSPGGNNADISDLVHFESGDPADSFFGAGFHYYWVSEVAGTRVLTATLRDDISVTVSVPVEVTHALLPSKIALALTPSTVTIGGTSQAFLSGTDEYGNAFGYNLIGSNSCAECNPFLASSEPGDLIDQETGVITFSSVGPRIITASMRVTEGDPMEAAATVSVTAAVLPPSPSAVTPPAATPPRALANTGASPQMLPEFAILAILGGVGALLLARRRTV